MPDKKYFFGLFGAFLLGIVALALAAIVFFFLIPFFIPLAVILGLGFIVIFIFILLWALIYVAMFFGVAIYYFGRPMKVKKTGNYNIRHSREAGRRQKGRTRRK